MSVNLRAMDLTESVVSGEDVIKKAAESIGLKEFRYQDSHQTPIYFTLPECYSITQGPLYDALLTKGCRIYHSGYGKYAIALGAEVDYTQVEEISLRILPKINETEKRVEFFPGIASEKCNPWSGFLVIFQALASGDIKRHPIVDTIAVEGRAFVEWERIGFKNVECLRFVFERCFSRMIIDLANSQLSPFDPPPSRDHYLVCDKYELLMETWGDQLKSYMRSLR